VGEYLVWRPALQAPDHLVESGLARPNRADKHRRVSRLARGVCDGAGVFVDIETDEKRSKLLHG
jgi:hypothetical protein